MKKLNVAVVMDDITRIHIKKDTTFALMLEAQARGHTLHYLQTQDLALIDGQVHVHSRGVQVRDDARDWVTLQEPVWHPLAGHADVVLMRKDPPFDMAYIYATYLLERAEAQGVRVINRPQSLRDCNEKFFATQFAQWMPPTLVAADAARLRKFIAQQSEAVVKPLDGMGGSGVFRLRAGDANISVVLEMLTQNGRVPIMAQRYLPEISHGANKGDKRILLINGEPVAYALARIPKMGEARGNLAAGGHGEGRELTARDKEICAAVGNELRQRGLFFVGLDVIGDYLTEINVTSPTCLRELEAIFRVNIKAKFWDYLDGGNDPLAKLL